MYYLYYLLAPRLGAEWFVFIYDLQTRNDTYFERVHKYC